MVVQFFIIRRRKEARLKHSECQTAVYTGPLQQYELYREFRQDGRESHNRHYLWAADRHDGGILSVAFED